MRGPRVFTVPPSVDFLPTFARALLDGSIIPGLSEKSDPLAFGRATIYVPTRRSRAALIVALRHAIGRPAAILPRILPLGAMEASEAPYFDESADDAPGPDLPRAIPDIERRLLLADLVLKWAEGVKHAIVSIDEQGRRTHDHNETLIVATTPADAWSLAGDLADLIDELIIEDVAWKSVTDAGAGEFDQFWRITTDFLDVAIKRSDRPAQTKRRRGCSPQPRIIRRAPSCSPVWIATSMMPPGPRSPMRPQSAPKAASAIRKQR
jgi:ATP-dependent helicase/nuclease subunit B